MLFQTIQGDFDRIRPLLRVLLITLCAIPVSAHPQFVDVASLKGSATTITVPDLPHGTGSAHQVARIELHEPGKPR